MFLLFVDFLDLIDFYCVVKVKFFHYVFLQSSTGLKQRKEKKRNCFFRIFCNVQSEQQCLDIFFFSHLSNETLSALHLSLSLSQYGQTAVSSKMT